MDIRGVITALCALQRGLAIAEPRAVSIRRVYGYPLPVKMAVPDRPCWMNSWTMTQFAGQGRNPDLSRQSDQRYAIHSQLFVGEATAEADVTAEIASAFHTAFLDALVEDPTLGGACHDAEPRGGDPTLALLERAGINFIGLDEYVDVVLYV